jgi:hypothetical protein
MNVIFRIRSPYLHQPRRVIASVSLCEIINVHAGAENCTAIHLHPFRELCQSQNFGFHRFFPGFSGFVRIRAHFSRKSSAKSRNFISSSFVSCHFVAAPHLRFTLACATAEIYIRYATLSISFVTAKSIAMARNHARRLILI